MNHRGALVVVLALLSSACDKSGPTPPASPSPAPTPSAIASSAAAVEKTDAATTAATASFTAKPFALPGVTAPASMDYIAYEPKASRVWAPAAAGGAGLVAVLDVASGKVSHIDGFKSIEREANGRKRVLGPSAVTIGDGVAYVGNRATSEICVVPLASLALGACTKLTASTDGVAYVASAKEVWVTNPREQTLTILDASKPDALKTKTSIKLDGAPEGYAVDDARGLFFTNLEDKNGTLAIDVKTHKVTSTWKSGCGEDGPRGLVVDSKRKLVVVACTDHLQVLDASGAPLGKLDTGAGVDNIDYLESKHLVFVGAAKAAKLTIARLDDKGQLTTVTSAETAAGARNPVVDATGAVFLTDATNARLLAFPPPP